MRLSKLKLYGFKSFADKTEFVFEPGVTAFVGPNGCGKSNVVDAVRWVLGEQRPKALRGSEMADVIFKGNGDGRRSLGFAEVALTFANEDRALPIEYDEVSITRRLYRSGESEYLINNQSCRLRDVRELLMDTGIGMDAYSVVEQGKIDLVLQSSPRDRRAIFEEAAGISKYNAKRRAAVAKLERVEQNLLRLGDTIEEVRKRLRSIKRQAATARRYKHYAESLGRLRLAQALHEYHILTQEHTRTEAAITHAEDQCTALAARTEALEAEKLALDAESLENDQRLARLDARLAEARAQGAAIEESIALNRERVRDADAAQERNRQGLAELARRQQGARQGLAAAQQRAQQLQAELVDTEHALEAARHELQEVTAQCSELGRLAEHLRTEVVDGLRQRAMRQNELAGIESDCRALEAQRQRHERRRQEISRLLAELEAALEENTTRTADTEREIEAARARFAARAEERGELRAQVECANEEIARQSNVLSGKTSRRDLLEDLEARFEGVELGTQTLLERRAEGQSLHGMVADLVEVAPQYALAIEAALGGAVQHLVADTLDAAAEAVSHLKAVDGGRSTLLPLDRLGSNGHRGYETLEHPGVLGRALDLIQFREDVRPAVKHLLGDTYVVSDLPTAVEIAQGTDRDVRLATLAGDVLQLRGPISGGSGRDRTGLLSRKNELRAIGSEIDEIEARLAQLRAQRDHFINESAVLDTELEEARQRLNELNLQLATLREQGSRLVERIAELRDESLVIHSELEEIRDDHHQRRTRADAIGAELEELESHEKQTKERLDAIDQQRRTADDERTRLERTLADLGVARAQKASERDHLKATADRLRSELNDIQAAEEHARSELDALATRRQAALDEIATRERDIRELLRQKDELASQRLAAENRRSDFLERAQALLEQIQAARTALREHEHTTQQLSLRKSEQSLRLANLAEKVREEHRQDLDQLHADYDEPDVDWSELQDEMAQIRRKLDGMGTVNLLAIDEQAELEERAEFLTSQEQDLLNAKHALQEVIRKVNRRSRQLFEQTFAAVRENFLTLYRKLFGGGKADIILEAGVDVLEAGVEIIAKPPGKEPSTLRLLSGGEKSLTAVALLLAIFKSKPSPFCVLDEVDAALDEANIGRFVGVLDEFLKRSQFLVVTHSKQTMAVADVLYGITMGEPGVSTRISVRLDDVEQIGVG